MVEFTSKPMEPLILFVWVVLLLGTPMAFIGSTGAAIQKGKEKGTAIGLCVFCILVHILIAFLTLFPIFVMMMAGAHSEPVGNGLNTFGRVLFITLEVAYAFASIAICSRLAGRSRPWPLPVKQ
jgi:hypothetical protein